MDRNKYKDETATRIWGRAARRVALAVALGGMALMELGCGLGETAAGDVRPGSAGPGATQIVMHDNAFEPASLAVAQGQPIQLEVRNDGTVNHNFTNDALHVSTGPVKPGEIVTVTVAVPAGATQFLCTWHPGMTIEIRGG